MNRLAALVPLVVLAAVACDDKTNTPTRILRRPLSLAVTCADATGTPLAKEKCGDDGSRLTSWVLDGDARGLSISYGSDTDRFDADPTVPGWTALAVGGDGVAVRSTPGSDLVVVAIAKDDVTGGPSLAWLVPGDLVPGVALDRAPLPCPPLDLVIAPAVPRAGGAPVVSALVLLDCADGHALSVFPVASLDQAADPRDGERRFPLPALPMGVGVTVDGALAYLSLRDPDRGDVVARVDLSKAGDDASALTTVALDEPAPVSPVSVPGCSNEGVPARKGTLVLGAPAPTPDGAFVYVPLAVPAGIAVFTGDLVPVDANAPTPGVDGSSSVVLARTGVRHIPLEAPVTAVAMVTLPTPTAEEIASATDSDTLADDGVRAFAVLESGQMTRIVVTPNVTMPDKDNPSPHRVEAGESNVDSSALMPVLRADGEVWPRGIVRNAEYPSFGMPDIENDPERTEKSVYYGIRFDDGLADQLSETWDLTYEGVLPGAGGCGTFRTEAGEARSGTFEDPTADFCATGVSEGQGPFAGDVLVVRPDPSADCDLAGAEALEYRILAVEPTRLLLEPAFVSLDLPPAGCLDGLPLRYEVRASGHWTVVGSRSGFLHNRESSGGACRDRADADPRFTGRARTTLPEDGGEELQSCPARLGDLRLGANLAAARFRNASFYLNVLPGCRTDSRFRPVVIPPVRDTRLTFQSISGFAPRTLALGGLPVDLSVAGTDLHVLDAGTGVVYEVDAVDNLVPRSWY